MRGKPVTEAEVAEMRRLHKEIGSFKGVARIMKRSPDTIADSLRGMRYRQRVLPEPRELFTVPAEVLAERERRYSLAPRSITAALFGDPLPGYSALDRRR